MPVSGIEKKLNAAYLPAPIGNIKKKKRETLDFNKLNKKII